MLIVALPVGNVDAIEDYASLCDVVEGSLDRDVDPKTLAQWTQLAEARFNRTLRVEDMYQVATVEMRNGEAELPMDYLALRPFPQGTAWHQVSPSRMYIPDRAKVFTLSGSRPVTVRVPGHVGFTYLDVHYYARIPPLGETNADNWLLRKHPDVYYAALMAQAEVWHVNDERVGMFKGAVDEALEELNRQGQMDRHGPNLRMRMDVP